eukprot:GFYU01010188.1.p1 GENE.GFYU01010188.1~~GFYU01010188.1.p1  ORF type:complete len:248 (-),score=69.41 GFYU01010188.1:381-1124(-)
MLGMRSSMLMRLARASGIARPVALNRTFAAPIATQVQAPSFKKEEKRPVLTPAITKALVPMSYSTVTSYDDWKLRDDAGDESKRTFTYFALGTGRFMYASLVRVAVVKFVATMSASADVLALASIEVDISKIAEGNSITVKWRGKPVFIRHRLDSEIELANAVSTSELRDPETDADRTQNPKYLVVLGVCTHLGCVPIGDAGDYQGWFCPCHGSHYDTSGRIRKGPAPLNLEVPEYKFTEEGTLIVG